MRSYGFCPSTALDNRFGEYYFDWIRCPRWLGELVRMASERSDELPVASFACRRFRYTGGNNDFPWLGIIIASPIIGIWYWCTDQYIVQRTLAAKNLTLARRGAIWGAFLKVWPVLIFLLPGLVGLHQRILHIPMKSQGILQWISMEIRSLPRW